MSYSHIERIRALYISESLKFDLIACISTIRRDAGCVCYEMCIVRSRSIHIVCYESCRTYGWVMSHMWRDVYSTWCVFYESVHVPIKEDLCICSIRQWCDLMACISTDLIACLSTILDDAYSTNLYIMWMHLLNTSVMRSIFESRSVWYISRYIAPRSCRNGIYVDL